MRMNNRFDSWLLTDASRNQGIVYANLTLPSLECLFGERLKTSPLEKNSRAWQSTVVFLLSPRRRPLIACGSMEFVKLIVCVLLFRKGLHRKYFVHSAQNVPVLHENVPVLHENVPSLHQSVCEYSYLSIYFSIYYISKTRDIVDNLLKLTP